MTRQPFYCSVLEKSSLSGNYPAVQWAVLLYFLVSSGQAKVPHWLSRGHTQHIVLKPRPLGEGRLGMNKALFMTGVLSITAKIWSNYRRRWAVSGRAMGHTSPTHRNLRILTPHAHKLTPSNECGQLFPVTMRHPGVCGNSD